MYEEQELTMQVFSEPEMTQIDNSGGTVSNIRTSNPGWKHKG